MNLVKIIKNLKKQLKKYNIKGSVLLLALFVLLFSFTIIIILYLINKRYVIYAKGERENYLKAIYPQKKNDILNYLLKKSVQEFYYTSLIYNQEGLYEVYKNSETFYTPLTAPLANIYMLYKLYSTNNLNTLRYYIDFNLYGYNTATTIYATAKKVDLTKYLYYHSSDFKFKHLLSKDNLNPKEKELIKKIIDINKQQISIVFKDLGNVRFNEGYIYEIETVNINPSNLSITKNIKNITIFFYVNDSPYKMIIQNTKIQTNISNVIDINTQTSDSNTITIIYPYMNTYIKSAIIQSTNARIIKL
jgi:hypothetical protein